MPTVKFTYALNRFFPNLEETLVEGQNLVDILAAIDGKYPGIKNYIVDERGSLRQHVNIFLDGELIKDKNRLDEKLGAVKEVFIMQALSGG